MELIDRLPCKHCVGSGTCKNGLEGASCAVCCKKSEMPLVLRWFSRLPPSDPKYFGVVCCICDGKGTIEPATLKFQNWMTPLLALGVTLFSGLLLWNFKNDRHFDAVLTFVGTLMGSVTGYYFAGQRAPGIASAHFKDQHPLESEEGVSENAGKRLAKSEAVLGAHNPAAPADQKAPLSGR